MRVPPQWPAWLLQLLLLVVLVTGLPAGDRTSYPTFDGSQNNAKAVAWGKAGTPFSRVQVPRAAAAGDSGADALAGANRPSARAITLALLNKPYYKASSASNRSYLTAAMGQLIVSDIAQIGGPNGGSAPIKVPPGDNYFWRFLNETPVSEGSRTMLPFTRTGFTRTTPNGPRRPLNQATAWLDASSLYGESAEKARLLRAGTAGRLLSDDNKLLPYNIEHETGKPKYTMSNNGERVPQTRLRLSGNPDANQCPLILSITTVLMREHNRRARLVEAANPEWSDEKIFNEARKWVIGHFQRLALNDYVSAVGVELPPYKGYNASLDPAIDAFFWTSAMQFGHATITDVVTRLDASWATHPQGHLTTADAWYNPDVVLAAGLEPIIRGMIAQPQGQVEPRWSLAVASKFAGDPTANGTDVAALTIQRGRDVGIPDYNTCRRALGLAPAGNFSDITPDTTVAGVLEEVYGNVNNIDAYVGGLAEPPKSGGQLGPLFAASIREQLARLRDADWWYYENGAANKLYSPEEIEEIRNTDLRDILSRTTQIEGMPRDIWTAAAPKAAVGKKGKYEEGEHHDDDDEKGEYDYGYADEQHVLFETGSIKDPRQIAKRKTHGTLMAISMIGLFPMGALAVRHLQAHWVHSPAIRASLFYVHIITQLVGTACITAGFAIAKTWVHGNNNFVRQHGAVGITALVLVYSQLILGFLRPTALWADYRKAWDIVHSTLGRTALFLGTFNVFFGITIYSLMYNAKFALWAGACAAGLGCISLLQHIMDRKEKYAVLERDSEDLAAHTLATSPGSQRTSFSGKDGAADGDSLAPPVVKDPEGPLVFPNLGCNSFREPLHPSASGPADPAAKLTANLLQHHDAAAAAGDSDLGVSQMPPGSIRSRPATAEALAGPAAVGTAVAGSAAMSLGSVGPLASMHKGPTSDVVEYGRDQSAARPAYPMGTGWGQADPMSERQP